MSPYTRRDFLRVGAYLAAGLGLGGGQGAALAKGLERILNRQEKVVWIQGMSCTGCSISLLNADFPGPVELLTEVISLVFHPNLSAVQGEGVLRTLEQATKDRDYLLVLEGAVPLSMPQACVIGGKPLTELLPPMLKNAKAIIAAGTCAAYGGVPAAEGNQPAAAGLKAFMEQQGIATSQRLVNCPGCPVHPHCLVGTLAYVIGKGYPAVDSQLLTPDLFFKHSVHDDCPRFHYWEKHQFAERFGDDGCLFKLGCLGPLSRTTCPRRQWNGGVNWCIRAGAPCIACTSDQFARRRDFPFYRKGEECHAVAYQEADRKGAKS